MKSLICLWNFTHNYYYLLALVLVLLAGEWYYFPLINYNYSPVRSPFQKMLPGYCSYNTYNTYTYNGFSHWPRQWMTITFKDKINVFLVSLTTILSSDRRKGPLLTKILHIVFEEIYLNVNQLDFFSDAQSVRFSSIKVHHSSKSFPRYFSSLSSTISYPEFHPGNQPSLRLLTKMDYSHIPRRFFSGPSAKTRNEISLINTSIPPSAFNWKIISFSFSHHFGKISKRPSKRIFPSRIKINHRAKVNSASNYFTDSNSIQDIWSLSSQFASIVLSPYIQDMWQAGNFKSQQLQGPRFIQWFTNSTF